MMLYAFIVFYSRLLFFYAHYKWKYILDYYALIIGLLHIVYITYIVKLIIYNKVYIS